MRKIWVVFLLFVIIGFSGCLEPSKSENPEPIIINNNQGISTNAQRLYEDYNWKLEKVKEIQQRADALGNGAAKEMYIEWKQRNSEGIESGERLATYINEHRDVLDQFWTSEVLVLIATNKVTFERDNRALEQKINSLEKATKNYTWKIDYYGREGSRDLGTLTFANRGKNLSNVKFRFVFYKDGAFYSEEAVPIGDVAAGKTIQKRVSLPGRYSGGGTWSQEKVYLHINGSIKEIQVYENDEWKEEQINKTG